VGAGLVYLAAAEAALGAAAGGDSSVRVRVLGMGAGGRGPGSSGCRGFRWMPAASGLQMSPGMLCKGQQRWQGHDCPL
jgi:hypothetical protein